MSKEQILTGNEIYASLFLLAILIAALIVVYQIYAVLTSKDTGTCTYVASEAYAAKQLGENVTYVPDGHWSRYCWKYEVSK